MKLRADAWILIGLFLMLFVGMLLFVTPSMLIENYESSTYNPDPSGVKAFYTLLERLNYKPVRLTETYDKIPRNAKILFIVEPTRPINDGNLDALFEWINKGGTVIIVINPYSKNTMQFSNKKYGKGEIKVIRQKDKITNYGMKDVQNAMDLLTLISTKVDDNSVVVFDEFTHKSGKKTGEIAIRSNVLASLIILCLSAIVICHTKGRRFGEVRPVESRFVRPSYEFVESVGRLYQRADAAGMASEIICNSFKKSLYKRCGIGHNVDDKQLFSILRDKFGEEITNRIQQSLWYCSQIKVGRKITESELFKVATEINELNRELGIG